MLKKEILRLSPQQRDVIVIWRILFFPNIITVEEIHNLAPCHSIDFIRQAIKTFNSNCRAKLEFFDMQKTLKTAMEEIWDERTTKERKKRE